VFQHPGRFYAPEGSDLLTHTYNCMGNKATDSDVCMGLKLLALSYGFMGSPPAHASMPYDERDGDTGQFTPSFADEDFLDAVSAVDGATTSEVADRVGCEYRTAYKRLGDLEDQGRVESREVGNSLLWEVADE